MPPRIFITAAEASGDQHAAELATALRQLSPEIVIEGLGGTKMAAAGVILHQETVGRAAMGWRGALRALEAMRWLRAVRELYRAHPPDLHICVDSSAINLPFASLARSFRVPVLYYIAPQLWASREKRIRQVRAWVNHVACILPFEEKWYRDRGVKATFVGHPLFDELPPNRAEPTSRFPDAPPAIGIIPGSRRSEVRSNLPPLLKVARRIRAEFPEATFLIPTTDATDEMVRKTWRDLPAEIVKDGFDQLIPWCDLALVKSGTSTLHVAAHNVPMIVVYRLNALLWHLAARWLIKTPKIALINILAGNRDLVPEFIPWDGSPRRIANCALRMLRRPEKLAAQREKLRKLISTLDRPGASMNAARIALYLIKPRP